MATKFREKHKLPIKGENTHRKREKQKWHPSPSPREGEL